MLTLEIIGPLAEKLGAASRKVFDSAGGTIGRSPGNDWVIPDSYISGCHARVHFRNGQFFMVDCSANGTSLKTRANRLTKGQWYPLANQDRLFLDSVEVRVGVDERVDAGAESPATVVEQPPGITAHVKNADVELNLHRTIPLAMPADAVLAALFGEERLDPIPERRFNTDVPLASHSQRSALEHNEDPTIRTVAITPANEAVPEGGDGIRHTEVLRSTPPLTPPLDISAVVSRQRSATPSSGAIPAASSGSSIDMPITEASGGASSTAPAPITDSVFIKGLLQGTDIPPQAISPELSDAFGQILRATVAGLMELLHERDAMKDSFRLNVTKFKPVENNPLRFSVNVEDALYNLLVKRNAAYLAPADAIAGSFKDALWHQAAMLVAIHAAFDGMLDHFDPKNVAAETDNRPTWRSFIFRDSDNPQWTQYRKRYAELAGQPDGGFGQLFGEHFARAYQQELDRLRDRERASHS